MDKSFHPTLYWACDYLPMLGLKAIRFSKRSRNGHFGCFTGKRGSFIISLSPPPPPPPPRLETCAYRIGYSIYKYAYKL